MRVCQVCSLQLTAELWKCDVAFRVLRSAPVVAVICLVRKVVPCSAATAQNFFKRWCCVLLPTNGHFGFDCREVGVSLAPLWCLWQTFCFFLPLLPKLFLQGAPGQDSTKFHVEWTVMLLWTRSRGGFCWTSEDWETPQKTEQAQAPEKEEQMDESWMQIVMDCSFYC